MLAWIIFGAVNGLLLNSIETNTNKLDSFSAAVLGITGALSGGVVAYFLLAGVNPFFNLSLSAVILLELLLFAFLNVLRPLMHL